MGSFARFGRYLRDFWQLVIRGENDDLQRQIRGVEAQVARLRERRIAKAKEREQSALMEVRIAVEKLQELHKSLLAAEAAASEFAAKLGDNAKQHMEAEMGMGQKARMKFLQRQKECFENEIKKEMQADSGILSPHLLSQLNERAQAPMQPKGSSADDSTVSSSSPFERLEQVDLPKKIGAEENGSVVSLHLLSQLNEETQAPMQAKASSGDDNTVSSSSIFERLEQVELRRQMGDKAEASMQLEASLVNENVVCCHASGKIVQQTEMQKLMDVDAEDKDVSPSVLAQLMEEAKKQVQLEEQTLIESLSRQREILHELIEDRAAAEHSTNSHDEK